ncbi:MAG: alpha/beta hydrolase [Alphaproteobacteria bacterium]|nr:MAG: alpha/beta hydrolase [Alphaproteobacteria bacterium]
MSMEPAPLYEDVADAPPGGRAWWLTAADGTRIRAAVWTPPAGTTPRGTVLLFPGRTEYVEKYGPAAREFTAAGLAMLTIDWRGQGLTRRPLPERLLGDVIDFSEYQQDVAAALALAKALDLPGPRFLVGHSMGGCIGLRALHEGLDVAAAAFSAPMWGVQMDWWEPALAWASALLAPLPFVGRKLTPRTDLRHALIAHPFEDNDLTTDRAMWEWMRRQITVHPELELGGPSVRWLRAALFETHRLTRMPPPKVPALAFLGSRERIVLPRAVERLMARWPEGRLVRLEGAEHEIMMERPEIRSRFYAETLAHFAAHAGG